MRSNFDVAASAVDNFGKKSKHYYNYTFRVFKASATTQKTPISEI